MASSAAQSTSETIPVKYEFQGSLRRSTIDVPPRLNQLRQKLAKSFPEFAHLFSDREQILRLVYTDDEGDEITIATNDELLAAYRLAQEAGKVLRFTIPTLDSKLPGGSDVTRVVATTPKNAAKSARKAAKKAAKTVEKVAKKIAQVAKKAAKKAAKASKKPFNQAAKSPVKHWGVHCDATGQSPIVGPRFHKKGENYDICQAAFDQLSSEDQEKFIRLDNVTKIIDWVPCFRPALTSAKPAKSFAEVQQPVVQANEHIVTFVRDVTIPDGTSVTPGQTFVKVWELDTPAGLPAGTQLGCEDAPNSTPLRCERGQYVSVNGGRAVSSGNFTVSVPMVSQPSESGGTVRSFWRLCDAEGHWFGPRVWVEVTPTAALQKHPGITCDVSGQSPIVGPRFWCVGYDYDLCEAEFNKLDSHEQARYLRIDTPFSREARRAAECIRQARRAAERRGACFKQLEQHFQQMSLEQPAQRVEIADDAQSADMTFVDDVTIDDGAVVAAGAKLRKVWRVTTESGWKKGTVLRCLDSDGPYVGFGQAVPPVPAGSRVELAISIEAPKESGASSKSFWGLFDNEGTRFGDQLWVEFETEPSPPALSTSGGGAAKSSAAVANAAMPNCDQLLMQVLAGMNLIPQHSEQQRLADQLMPALKSGDFTSILQALAALNITIQK
eukprot:INCI3016.1.p1 GENE.INCI3016.1~~INCI3016.1.p1  ORF type:complete len:667 (-),score=157.07 INCI3016.1:468-2468(-)